MAVATMVSVWSRMARERGERPAITVGDRPSVLWSDLQRRSNQLARVYADHGVVEGDRVVIALPTGEAAVESLMAAIKLGGMPTPIPASLPRAERERIIELADPRLVVSETDGADSQGRWMTGTPDLAGIDGADLPEIVAPSFKASVSGGSTGRPKVIVSGFPAAIDDSPIAPFRLLGVPVDSCCLFPGPLYHNTATTGIVAGLSLRNHIVLEERFDAEMTLRLIERHGVTFATVVPTMMNRIWLLPEEVRTGYDMSRLQVLMHNAAPCPPDLKRAWIDWLGAGRIYENYGATERTAFTLCSGREWLERPPTVGKAVFGEMRIQDGEGRPCPPGEVGYVWMRRPEGTQPTYRYIGEESTEGHDGWETVGDMGHMDEDGYLFIADRRKDLIISGGANIYPAEVEAAVAGHAAVIECVVIGLADDDLGQRVHAIVHSDRGALTDQELDEFVRGRLARYKCPRSYEYTSEELRDDAGKVRRSQLLEERSAMSTTQTS